jgi:hypothetical protein
MGTLADQIQADVAGVFLNVDDFASVDSYTAVGEAARDVHGIAEELVATRQDEETGDEETKERIRYFCGRDAAEFGIEDPQIGDKLVLVSDPDSSPYTFSGEIQERDAVGWWLVFWRWKRTGRGAMRA